MIKRAVIYARVSTSKQEKEGYSLQTQIEGCMKYAKSKNISVIKTFQDDISGATNLDERNGGLSLLKFVSGDQNIDTIIVWRLDRLSRPPEGEYSRLLTTIEHFARNGITIHDCETGPVKNDMASIMIAFFKGLAASQERTAITERCSRGRIAKVKSGKWVGNNVPYGFRKVGKGANSYLEHNEEQVVIIKRIFDLYTAATPIALTDIARLLNDEGIPSPTNKLWHPTSVKRILTRRTVLGEFTYSDHTVEFPELAIVDEETWQAVQARFKRNKLKSPRNRKYNYLLSGHIFCVCGGRLSGTCIVPGRNYEKNKREGKVNLYYTCSKYYSRIYNRCRERKVRAEKIERAVWDWITELLSDDSQLEEGLQEMLENSSVINSNIEERITTVERLLQKTDAKIARLVAAFGEEENPTVANALKNEIANASQLKESLQKERETLTLKLSDTLFTQDMADEIRGFATKVRKRILNGNFQNKRRVLELLNVKVMIQKDDEGKRWAKVTCDFFSDGEGAVLHPF